MIWQDVLFMMGGFGFGIALLPSVIRKIKMPVITPLVTAVILSSYLIAYATLDFWLAFASGCLTAGMWWYLLAVALKDER